MSPTPLVPFLSIDASAGSGKTFALAHRVLRLLAMEVPPDRLGAYTFSRKAAGEIFDEIVRYLREAAEDPNRAATTSGHMGMERDSAGFLRDLRSLLSQLHRLRIGTLDSRIAQMLAAAAVELQLPPEFGLLDGQGPEARFLHERVLDELLRPGALPGEATDAFLSAFELATHGMSEKAFDRKLLDFIADHRAAHLLVPNAEAWHHPGPLPLPDPPRALDRESLARLETLVRESLPELGNNRLVTALEKQVDKAAAYTPGKSWSKDAPTGTLVDQVLGNDRPELTYYKKAHSVPADLWEALRLLFRHSAGMELERCFAQTRGLHLLLETFETRYREHALARGQVTFEDASALMAGFNLLPPGDLAFRLDGEIDHWLLDEFQDTSTLQWRAIEPFVDEVLQDAEQRRTFFYVGDVKQAIYAWRGGNADLFSLLREQWPVISTAHMETSQRSAPPVLDLVNHLLHDIPDLEEFPSEAVARWNREYRPHVAAERHQSLPGFARVYEMEDKEETETVDLLEPLLREIDPSLETAILTRSNATGAELADALRRKGFEVVQEGQSALRNDTAVEVVLAALTLAAHPGDHHSRRVLEMAGREVFPFHVLRDVQEHGFAHALPPLFPDVPTASYAAHRLEQLLRAAREFDDLGSRSIDRFLAFVDGYRLSEHTASGVIRVMTIHQSKGLGFDVVFFPVESSGFVNLDSRALTTSPTGRKPAWVLSFPPADVCKQTFGLDRELERLEAESAYENLCNLYVALTRAKQGLCVLLPPAPKKSGSPRVMHNWIRARLDGVPAAGDAPDVPGATLLAAHGVRALPPKDKPATQKPQREPLPLEPGEAVVPRLEPSQADDAEREIGRLFRLIPEDGRELGTRVHALLEKIQWSDTVDTDEFLAEHGEPLDSDAARHVRNALSLPALRRPKQATGLWREQRFETILPGGWITGIFDRVVLFEDRAWIQDYKTNKRVNPETIAHYIPQMRLYREVLSDTLGIPEQNITCQLLFTATGEICEVEF